MIISIDPGQAGGIAYRFLKGTAGAFKMPPTPHDILGQLRDFACCAIVAGDPITVVIEEQTGCGGIRTSAPSMFKFGKGYGYLLGVCDTLQIRVELVRPQRWMKDLGLGTRDKSLPRSAWKNKLRERAAQLFPALKVTLATADALLMLEWKRLQP